MPFALRTLVTAPRGGTKVPLTSTPSDTPSSTCTNRGGRSSKPKPTWKGRWRSNSTRRGRPRLGPVRLVPLAITLARLFFMLGRGPSTTGLRISPVWRVAKLRYPGYEGRAAAEGGWQCCTRRASSSWVSSPASSGFFRHGLATTENAAIRPTKDLPSGIYRVTAKDVPFGRCAGSSPTSTVMPVETMPILLTAVCPTGLRTLVEG
jgi:hypothetical protein